MASSSNSSEPNLSTNSLRLIIKSANQKYDDFIVDNFDQEWSIKRLKQHLSDNYPKNPEIESIRLIYSGKLLHDHCILKEVLRQNSEIKAHIIHLVQSSANSNKLNQSSSTNRTNNNSTNSADDNEIDLDNELTPNSSSASSSSESTSSSSTSSPIPSLNASHVHSSNNPFESSNTFSRIQTNLNNLFQQQQQQQQQNQHRQEQSNLTPKQKFNQIHESFIRYYELNGIPVQTNSWYSTYVQHMALYNYMYLNYLQSLEQTYNEIPLMNLRSDLTSNEQQQEQTTASTSQPTPQAQPPPPPPPPAQPQPQNRAPARDGAANPDAIERDDDWLSLLHNIVSFLVLFSIIYYYSSMERFLVIFTIVLILILYHNGWLSLQRRHVRNVPNNRREANQQDNQREPNNIRDENNRNENENQIDQNMPLHPEPPANPSTLRLIATFIITFFTSLVPERPRVAAN